MNSENIFNYIILGLIFALIIHLLFKFFFKTNQEDMNVLPKTCSFNYKPKKLNYNGNDNNQQKMINVLDEEEYDFNKSKINR